MPPGRHLALVVVAAAALASVATSQRPLPRGPSIPGECSTIRARLHEWTADRIDVDLGLDDPSCRVVIVAGRAGPDGALVPLARLPDLKSGHAQIIVPAWPPTRSGALDLQLDGQHAWRLPLRDGQLGEAVRIPPFE